MAFRRLQVRTTALLIVARSRHERHCVEVLFSQIFLFHPRYWSDSGAYAGCNRIAAPWLRSGSSQPVRAPAVLR